MCGEGGRGKDRAGWTISVGRPSLHVLPVFFPPEIVEELKNSSCREVLEKYDSFSTKVSSETLRPDATPAGLLPVGVLHYTVLV